jgi:hypothetical protein
MSIVEYFKKKDGMIFKPQKKGIIFSPQPQKFHTARNYLLYDNHLLYNDSILVSRLFYELIVSYLNSSLKRSSFMKIFRFLRLSLLVDFQRILYLIS